MNKKKIFTFNNFIFYKPKLWLNIYKRLFLERITKILSKSINKIYIFKNNLSITIKKETLIKILFFFKKYSLCQFNNLIDITCIDFLDKQKRFQISYNLLSLKYKTRLRINLEINELETIPSINTLFNGSSWLEREIWDMFGIFFSGHEDLRRILTDYGFEGFPLRKDFPLMGFVEIRYDDENKRIVYEPVELTQQYRTFTFENPWQIFANYKQDEKTNFIK